MPITTTRVCSEEGGHTVAAAEPDLLESCRRGDGLAWDRLFDLHYAATARFIFQLGYDFRREDVEEICQEVFLAVIKNLDSFAGQSRFQTWLFRIAANKARDYYQHHRAAKRGGGSIPLPLHSDDSERGPSIDPPSSLPAPNEALLRSEKMALVGQALRQLRNSYREIIELRYFADLSYEEIAATLGLHPKTVSSRLSKALDKLEPLLCKLLSLPLRV
jgi:RNA polymerase sigma-70 factor (ECF subfamily)